jgi:hypothetical protein
MPLQRTRKLLAGQGRLAGRVRPKTSRAPGSGPLTSRTRSSQSILATPTPCTRLCRMEPNRWNGRTETPGRYGCAARDLNPPTTCSSHTA